MEDFRAGGLVIQDGCPIIWMVVGCFRGQPVHQMQAASLYFSSQFTSVSCNNDVGPKNLDKSNSTSKLHHFAGEVLNPTVASSYADYIVHSTLD